MRKAGKVILKALIALLLVSVLAIGILAIYLTYAMNWKKTTIAEYTNYDNSYTVVFEQVGDAFLFGPHKAKVTLRDARGRKVASAVTTIYNDGGYLSKWNADVVWETDRARITIRGAEQEDEVIELYYKRQ